MDQCFGQTLKHDRCKRKVKRTATNFDGTNAFCTVHIHQMTKAPAPIAGIADIADIAEIPADDIVDTKAEILKRIPADLYNDVKDLPIADLEALFPVTNIKLTKKYKKEDILKTVPAELINDVKDLPLEDLMIVFPMPENKSKIKIKRKPIQNPNPNPNTNPVLADDVVKRQKIYSRIPPELLNDVKDLSISDLEQMFPNNVQGVQKTNQNKEEEELYIDIVNNYEKGLDQEFLTENQTLFECQCCYCENFINHRVKCSEGHEFCRECLSRYVTDRITGGDYQLKCMSPDNSNCEGHFNHNILKKILEPKLYRTYCEKETQEIMTQANISDIYTCPKCLIYYAILDDTYKGMQKEPKFICGNPDCKYVSCYKCRNEFHGNIDCNYNKRDKDVRKTIEEILTKNRTRSCPKCNKEFLRIDGCNKMTCSCKTKSCYICRKQVQNYDHFQNLTSTVINGKCPLYINEKDVEKMSFVNALNEIYETYKNEKQKVIDEVYPILTSLEPTFKPEIDKKFVNVINNEQDANTDKSSCCVM